MTGLRGALRTIRHAVGAPRHAVGRAWGSLVDWQAGIPDEGRVVLAGLGLLAGGLAALWPPAAAIVPGAVLVVVGLGFNFKHPAAAIALVVAAGVVLLALTVVR